MSAAFSRLSAPKPRSPRSRLPWWAPALAVASFVVLPALISSPAEASAASASQRLAPLLDFLARIVGAAS